MKLYFLKILVVLGGISTSSCGDIGDQPHSGTHEYNAGQKSPGTGSTFRVPRNLNDTDSAFMYTAKTAGLLEIAAGKVALQKTTQPHVKNFALLMVKEHTDALGKLREIARIKGISLPDTLRGEDRRKVEELSAKSGQDFNQAYIDVMVESHDRFVEIFRDANRKVTDIEVNTYAKELLPALLRHQRKAHYLRDSL